MSSSGFYSQDSVSRLKKRKARFSFTEVHTLLQEVRKHRMVVVGKYNRGVPTDMKKQAWTEITARVNEIGECQREVMEVIKKWSDLKCDTKRKVSAMQAGTVPNRGPNSLLSRDINATEKVVLQILEMGDDSHGNADFGPLSHDDDEPEEEEEDEDEEEEEEDEEEEMDEEDSLLAPSSPNGGLDAPPPAVGGVGPSGDSSQPAFESQEGAPLTEDAAFGDSDEDPREEPLPSTAAGRPAERAAETRPPLSNGERKASSSGGAEPSPRAGLLHGAALSLQEQHATNVLLETVSRSLELLSESVQQLAETQQEFVRESLQLQRDTVQVLRDFTGGAIALMHDRLNGRPAV